MLQKDTATARRGPLDRLVRVHGASEAASAASARPRSKRERQNRKSVWATRALLHEWSDAGSATEPSNGLHSSCKALVARAVNFGNRRLPEGDVRKTLLQAPGSCQPLQP